MINETLQFIAEQAAKNLYLISTAEHSFNCLYYCDFLAEKPSIGGQLTNEKGAWGREQLIKGIIFNFIIISNYIYI